MNFEEYKQSGRATYGRFVEAVRRILEEMLKQHDLVAYSVSGRAKEASSLLKKLVDRNIDPAEQIEELIKDLAGCRIVFLTNSQVDRFNNTGALHENFEIIDVNVHHPVPGTDSETRLFDSTNYLVRLKPDRLALAEYRAFSDMRIEIQVQTLLNHAWAEMGHDTIYKEPKLENLGKARMTAIGERMNRVMQEHLKPAGYDFDKIAGDFRRLVDADAAAVATVAVIRNPADNNAIDNALEKYADLVLPHYDEPDREFLEILDPLVICVEKSRDNDVVPVETGFGTYPGRTSLDVARRVSELLSRYRYLEPVRTFHLLLRLWRGAADEDERAIWRELAKTFAGHNTTVWKKVGPAVQDIIVQQIGAIELEDVKASTPVLAEMLGELLSPEAQGASWRSDSVSLERGAVKASDVMRRIRSAALDYLEAWLADAADDSERREILRAMRRATRAPDAGNMDAALARLILEDTTRVLTISRRSLPQWGLELLRKCEIDALHIFHRFYRLREDLAGDAELAAEHARFLEAHAALREALNAEARYQLYKTLVGYDSVRPDAWDGDFFDPQKTDEWRRRRYDEIVATIAPDGIDAWIDTVEEFTAEVGYDGGNLIPMRDFLRRLAAAKPAVAIAMLDRVNDKRSSFISSMLHGLDDAGRGADSLRLVERWIGQGAFLRPISDYLRFKTAPDSRILAALVGRAMVNKEAETLATGATVAAIWYEKAPDRDLIETAFLPAVSYFRKARIPHWIKLLWTPQDHGLVAALSREEAADLLESFIDIRDVDHSIVRILGAVAGNFPDLAIDFFSRRIAISRTRRSAEFDAVPFDAYDIAEIFGPHAALLIPAMRKSFSEVPEYFSYRGGRLISHAFPELVQDAAQALSEIARGGTEDDLKFVLKTLAAYDGADTIYAVCMDVVEQLEVGDKLLSRVKNVLEQTGVVAGEFGFVEAYGQQRDLINQWRDDPRPKVRDFARAQARELEQTMAWEQRRASRDEAQRRRDWGEE